MASPFKTYLFSYNHDGARWAFDIQAKDAADARRRLASIAFAKYDGELVASIPVPGGGILASLRRALESVLNPKA